MNLVACMFFLIPSILLAAEFPKPALVSADAVRVRETASEKGKYVGVLYLNMKVQVLEKSSSNVKIENVDYPWYKIKADDFEGWCAGKFLEFSPKSWEANTYAASGDMEWFNNRYGDATAFNEASFDEKSFSINEYRMLMDAATKGNDSAYQALNRSIIPYLEANPNDLTYSYIKKRLITLDYFAELIDAGIYFTLPKELAKTENLEPLVAKVKKNYQMLNYLPESMRDNEKFRDIALEKHNELITGVTKKFINKEFVLKAVKKDKRYCPIEFMKDKVVVTALADSKSCWHQIDEALVTDQEFKKKILKAKQEYQKELEDEP